jgi:hypothetical protein
LRALLVTKSIGAAIKKFWAQIKMGYFMLYLSNLAWLILHYSVALIAMYQLAKEKNPVTLFLLLAPIIYLLIITAPAGSERFRFPAMPYLYLLSGFAISRIQRLILFSPLDPTDLTV